MKTSSRRLSKVSTSTQAFIPRSSKGGLFAKSRKDENGLSGKPFIQPKLKVGHSGDKFEQEANAVADQVVQRTEQPKTSQVQKAADGMIMKQDRPESARELASPIPSQIEENYAMAVRRVSNVNRELGSYLARGSVDRHRIIRTEDVPSGSQGQVTRYRFELHIVQEQRPADNPAQFRSVGSDPANGFYPMEIGIDLNRPIGDVASRLFHEGLHMQLHMDEILPSARRSSFWYSFEQYKQRARGSSHYPGLRSMILNYITRAFSADGSPSDLEITTNRRIWQVLEEAYVTALQDANETTFQNVRGTIRVQRPNDWLRPWIMNYIVRPIRSRVSVPNSDAESIVRRFHQVVNDAR